MQRHQKIHDNIVHEYFLDHIRYVSILKHVIGKSISERRTATPDLGSSYKKGMSLQLEDIGVGPQIIFNSYFLY